MNKENCALKLVNEIIKVDVQEVGWDGMDWIDLA